jgi:acetoin utilization deacetylase AcuC-like enzyme
MGFVTYHHCDGTEKLKIKEDIVLIEIYKCDGKLYLSWTSPINELGSYDDDQISINMCPFCGLKPQE